MCSFYFSIPWCALFLAFGTNQQRERASKRESTNFFLIYSFSSVWVCCAEAEGCFCCSSAWFWMVVDGTDHTRWWMMTMMMFFVANTISYFDSFGIIFCAVLLVVVVFVVVVVFFFSDFSCLTTGVALLSHHLKSFQFIVCDSINSNKFEWIHVGSKIDFMTTDDREWKRSARAQGEKCNGDFAVFAV